MISHYKKITKIQLKFIFELCCIHRDRLKKKHKNSVLNHPQ